MTSVEQQAEFELLSAVGASALSIWRLRGSVDQLQHVVPKIQKLEVNQPRVVLLRDLQGRVFDQAMCWLRNADGEVELHLHGGHGPAMALRGLLNELGWQERLIEPDPFVQARGSLNAKWLSLKPEQREQASSWAKVLESPPRIVLAGPPNSGKSTLFNAWLSSHRVTVSPHPGTTRDAVEVPLLIPTEHGSWQATLVDTAGIWASHEELDQRAIEQAQLQLAQSWTVIWVFDLSANHGDVDRLLPMIQPHHLLLAHKVDLIEQPAAPAAWEKFEPILDSAHSNGAVCVEKLERKLSDRIGPIPAVICS